MKVNILKHKLLKVVLDQTKGRNKFDDYFIQFSSKNSFRGFKENDLYAVVTELIESGELSRSKISKIGQQYLAINGQGEVAIIRKKYLKQIFYDFINFITQVKFLKTTLLYLLTNSMFEQLTSLFKYFID